MVEKEPLCSSAAAELSCCGDAAVKKANAGSALGRDFPFFWRSVDVIVHSL